MPMHSNLIVHGFKIEYVEKNITVDSKIFEEADDGIYNVLTQAGMIGTNTETGERFLAWPTNLMGKARIDAQLQIEDEDGDNTLVSQFSNTMIFVALVIYTILFVFRYLKRVLMIAFLTIIAPFVAMTYPLDKMGDGSAQAFNMWLKEYLYNLLIQPVHLILYTILISTAFEFAINNPLYTLAALGFLLQAEKIMRKFFGFEKASTLSGGSALGGALAMQAINSVSRLGGPKKGKKGAGKDGKGDGEEKGKIRTPFRKPDDGNKLDDLIGGVAAGGAGAAGVASRVRRTSGAGSAVNRASSAREASRARRSSGAGSAVNRASSARNASRARRTNGSGAANRASGSRRAGSTGGASGTRNIRGATGALPTSGNANKATKTTKAKKLKGAAAVAAKGLAYVAPKAARMAVKGTMAGTGAMFGVAAGLVSDDYSNAVKWGATGAGAGWIGADGVISAGKGIVGTAEGAVDVAADGIEDAVSTYTLTAYGSDAEEERQKASGDKAAVKDPARRKKYAEKLGLKNKAAIDEAMDQYQSYRSAGITDDDVVIGAMKSKSLEGDRDSTERIIAAGLAAEVGKDPEKLDYVKEQLANRGIADEDIARYEKGIKEINKWTI